MNPSPPPLNTHPLTHTYTHMHCIPTPTQANHQKFKFSAEYGWFILANTQTILFEKTITNTIEFEKSPKYEHFLVWKNHPIQIQILFGIKNHPNKNTDTHF